MSSGLAVGGRGGAVELLDEELPHLGIGQARRQFADRLFGERIGKLLFRLVGGLAVLRLGVRRRGQECGRGGERRREPPIAATGR